MTAASGAPTVAVSTVAVEEAEDAWAHGPHGSFWGRHGAAGLVIQNRRGEVLLQLRAPWCHHPGTWGIPGGARRLGECARDAALRECVEEHDFPVHDLSVGPSHTLDFGYWSYVTFVAQYAGDWMPGVFSDETVDVRWIPLRSVTRLPLHPGLAGTWRHLRPLLAAG